jgi:hypothetical protein
MLGRHPDLYAFPELALFRRPTLGDMLADPPGWRGQPTKLRLGGLYRALAQLHDGRQTEETIARSIAWVDARRSWTPGDVLDHLFGLVAPRISIEKSPENSSREDYLARLLASFPRARYIHLTRHPVTTVGSMHSVWHDRGYWKVPPELFHHFCLGIWYHQHLRIQKLFERLPPDRALLVRSEELTNSPAVVLPSVCRWFGVDPSEESVEQMLHPEDSPYAQIGPAGALGGADSGFLRAPKLLPVEEPDSLDLPGEWRIDPWLRLSAMELAHRFGYGPAS